MNILFICTGNTCRSPMAAAIMNKLAIENDLDIRIESAGLFANEGDPASQQAIEAVKKYDIDLSSHKAKQLTPDLISQSDLIVTMTEAHKLILQDMAADKTRTLCELADMEGDIPDPFGGDEKEYEETADKLYIALTQLSDKLAQIQENQQQNEL